MHGPAVFQVAYQHYVQAVYGSLIGSHGEKIQEGLRRVGSGTVPCVYYRVYREFGRQSGSPLVGVPEDNGVTIGIDHTYGVGQRLPFGYGGHRHLRNVYHIGPQPVGGALEGEPRPGGGLEEQIAQDLPGERLPCPLPHSVRHHLLRKIQKFLDLLPGEILYRYNITVVEIQQLTSVR